MPNGITYVPILIHTSVKLVTNLLLLESRTVCYFNPHEREARDGNLRHDLRETAHFNPHEREARDPDYYRCANGCS